MCPFKGGLQKEKSTVTLFFICIFEWLHMNSFILNVLQIFAT